MWHMKQVLKMAGLLVLTGVITSCNMEKKKADYEVQKMTGIPDEEVGYSLGVSACYAGTIGNQLIMAGGCNFPETPVAEGGKKKFYQGIYTATVTADSLLAWRKVGELPQPAAYGVTVSIGDGLILAGGTNAEGALSAVYRLSLSADNQRVVLDTLRSLPFALDNMAGTVVGNKLFLLGGNAKGKPSNGLYSIVYTEPGASWRQETPFPGNARIQPVCAGQQQKGGGIYMWGGFAPSVDGSPATLSTDGYYYSLAKQTWTPVGNPVGDDLEPVSLGGGIAYSVSDTLIVCTGGVNKDIFLSALVREELLKQYVAAGDTVREDSLRALIKQYMLLPPKSYQFNDKILVYDTQQNLWKELGKSSAMARAGAGIAGNGSVFYCINGELKPGIRTPEISRVVLK